MLFNSVLCANVLTILNKGLTCRLLAFFSCYVKSYLVESSRRLQNAMLVNVEHFPPRLKIYSYHGIQGIPDPLLVRNYVCLYSRRLETPRLSRKVFDDRFLEP